MTLSIDDWFKGVLPIEPMHSEPYGTHRCDPELVAEKKFGYVVKECYTCGRKYAYERYRNINYKNCCSLCSQIWSRYKGLTKTDKKLRLFFYRVIAVRELNGVFKDEIEHVSYSPLEMDILMMLKGGEKQKASYGGHTVTMIAEKMYGEIDSADYTRVFKACKKLINKGLVRKYAEVGKRVVGRPRMRYKLNKKVYIVKKMCPNCGNNKYWVDSDERTFNCIYCKARWVIPK